MNTIRRDSTRAQAQEAFVGLLSTPLIAARANSELYAAILRHQAIISDWVARLGYRLVIAGRVARLHRDPAGPQLTAAPPPWDPPSRRDLVLVTLTAAACEDADSTTTVQALSDQVRALSASARVTGYDPDRRVERQAFVRCLARLADLGVIIRRTSDDALLRQWEDEGTGVGAGYEVDREALLLFTDPYTVHLALTPRSPVRDEEDASRIPTRSQRLLRTLVEDTALLYADLHPIDAEYARGQRSWLAGQAADMTGGVVEIREEGMLLRLPEDRLTTARVTAAFPAAAAAPWFALKILDAAAAGRVPDERGRFTLTSEQVDATVARAYTDNFRALTNALRDSPARLRAAVEPILIGLGLIRLAPMGGGWVIQAVAGRYRNPKAAWEPAAEELL
ncbi:MAG: DUF2398 family protein [Micromonosporaceae bacterium]